MKRMTTIKLAAAGITAAVALQAGIQLNGHRRFLLPIVAGPGVTKVVRLSDYCPGLRGTEADTKVFFLKGREAGGKMIVLGNTHANEPAGLLTAVILIENAVVEKGTLVIVPQFNLSGGRNTRPGDGYPLYFDIPTPWGAKRFSLGNRDASPLDQWPDPDVYIHYPDRQLLSFLDIRNTNRTWPGRPGGALMERVTYAALELMRRENIDLAVDIHGAETMFPVTNCIVAPDSSVRLATMTALTVKAREGFDSHVEPSPKGFRGLSHREIGDYSETLPFLLEAPIPFLDQPTGPKTTDLLLNGKDPFLLSLSRKGMLFVPYDESGWPMEKRVGQHCSVVLELCRQFSRRSPERAILIQGVPRYAEVLQNGVGFYYHDPERADPKDVYTN
jgi:predicted deacylase